MTDPLGERAPEDLTARARIRDAALRRFAERGIGPATIRDIAAAAGVSSGLVRHHFGSKEALRDACDAYAVERMAHLREQLLAEGRVADTAFVGAIQPAAALLRDYLMRSMMDGSEAAASVFDEMIQAAERWLTDHKVESHDLRAHAAVLVVMQMGVSVLHEQLSRALGVNARTPEGHARTLHGFVDSFTHPLLDAEQAAQVHGALDRLQAHPSEGGAQEAARPKEYDDERGDSH